MSIPESDLLDSPEAGGVTIRGTAVRTLGFGVVTVLGIVSAPFITRHLGVEDFGRYATITSLVGVVVMVTDAGLGVFGGRELARLQREEGHALLRNLIGLRIVLTLAGLAFAVAFAALAGYGGPLVLGTVLAGVGAFAYLAQGMLSLPLGVKLRLGWITAGDVLRQAVFVATVILLVVADASVVVLLAATIPAGLAGTALLAYASRDDLVARPAIDRAAWVKMLRRTLPIAIAGVLYTVYFRVVILLMSLIATAEQTGNFALSFRIVEVLVTIPFLVVGSTLPVMSRAASTDQQRLGFAWARTFDVCVAAGAGLALMTYMGAPLAMTVLTGDATVPATTVLEIQALALLVVFLNVAYGIVLVAIERTRDLVMVNATALVVTIVATLVLVPLAGAEGGAAATVVGEFCLLAASAIVLRRARPDLRVSLRVFPRAAVAAAAAVVAGRLVEVPGVPNLASAVAAVIVFVAVLFALRGVPGELLDALKPRRMRP